MTATASSTAPELVHLNPNTIDIGDNVRLDPRLDADFLASIAEHGVRAPVTAVRTADGTVTLRDGQRRTQAARQQQLATIPVLIYPAEADNADRLRSHRIIEQIVLNNHRLDLTEAERARGINQLLLDGISATKVAKQLSTTKDAVAAARTAAESPTAMTALDTGQLSLTEATRGRNTAPTATGAPHLAQGSCCCTTCLSVRRAARDCATISPLSATPSTVRFSS